MTAARPRPQYPVGSVDRALRLLSLFEDREQVRLSEAAREIGVADSTAHRLLSMLVYHGFVDQAGDRASYRRGAALLRIGLSAARGLDLPVLAAPFLERLVEALDETVHLAQLEGQWVRFIDSREGSQALRVTSRLGRTLPAHATSVGKAMLAGLSDDELAARYPGRVLPETPAPPTRRTVANWDELGRVVAAVRRTGYARNAGESEDGVSSVGVAVRRSLVAVPTGLSVAVPTARAGAARLRELAAALLATVAELETVLARGRPG